MSRITKGEIQKAKDRYRFIALRDRWYVYGVNCSIRDSCRPGDERKPSSFYAVYEITFSEYIRIKVPFIATSKNLKHFSPKL